MNNGGNMIPGDLTSEKAGPILADWSGEIEVYIGPDTGWIPAATLRGTPVFALHQNLPQRLNPARREVRDHAAYWLARHHGLTVGATAPEVSYHQDPASPWWRVRGYGGDVVFFTVEPSPHALTTKAGARWLVLPTLEGVTDPPEFLTTACLAAGGR